MGALPLVFASMLLQMSTGGGGGVGITTCDPKDQNQLWEPLSPASSSDAPPMPIRHTGRHGISCISAQPCASRAANCMVALAPCNATDPFQLFRFNASTGVVFVPPGAAGPKVPPTEEQCFNVWGNKRSPGYAIDVYTCGPKPVPTGLDAVTLRQDAKTGMLHLRDATRICVAVGFRPPPPPAPPHAPDPELDCAMRLLALERAAANLPSASSASPRNLRSVWDALELGSGNCSGVPPRPAAPRLPHGMQQVPLAGALFVDSGPKGNDANPGTEVAPLHTVAYALELSISRSAGGGALPVVLRGGVHFLSEALRITPAHSGLQLRAYPGESVTLSGGTPLRLSFRPQRAWWTNRTLLVANVPDNVPRHSWTELFVKDGSANPLNDGPSGFSRYTKARWPNGNPEEDSGLCTVTNGCPAYSVAQGSCGSVPFVNGTWVEITSRRNSWNAVSNCPATNDSSVFAPEGKCAMGKCCVGYVRDDWCALVGGSAAGRFDPPMVMSGSVFDQQQMTNCVRVGGFSPRAMNWTLGNRHNRPVLHSFNYPLGRAWGSHQYEVTSADIEIISGSAAGNLSLGRGGWHLTAGLQAAQSFFVENVKEECDDQAEFYVEEGSADDQTTRQLWIVGNGSLASLRGTNTQATVEVEVVLAGLKRLVDVVGGANAALQPSQRVRDVEISGLSLTHSAQTFVPAVGGPYEVPSDGDWSILREGAIVITGATNISVRSCRFWRLGGNGIVLSDFARNNTIAENEFGFLGESAVVSVGTATLNDGTKPSYPRGNAVVSNHMHDLGLWGKQVAGYTQFVTTRSLVHSNVIYNTPRAGINLNDNFGGKNEISYNVVFNTVRETNDHGPLNSWSRQGWITTEGPTVPGEIDGQTRPSTAVSWNLVKGNMLGGFSANQHGAMPLDYDDGTEYMHSVSNVLMYGGLKACWHSNNQRYEDNLIVRPDLNLQGPYPCSLCPAGAPDPRSFQQMSNGGHWLKNESKIGDVCINPYGQLYGPESDCRTDDLNGTYLWAANSTYYTAATPVIGCQSNGSRVGYNLTEWDRLWDLKGVPGGGERGSVVRAMPRTAEVVAMARARLTPLGA